MLVFFSIHSPPPPTNNDMLTQDVSPKSTENNENSCENSSTTPSRISFRLNPDGSRVSISRPPLPTNLQSPLSNSLRRVRNVFLFYKNNSFVFLELNGCYSDYEMTVNISIVLLVKQIYKIESIKSYI